MVHKFAMMRYITSYEASCLSTLVKAVVSLFFIVSISFAGYISFKSHTSDHSFTFQSDTSYISQRKLYNYAKYHEPVKKKTTNNRLIIERNISKFDKHRETIIFTPKIENVPNKGFITPLDKDLHKELPSINYYSSYQVNLVEMHNKFVLGQGHIYDGTSTLYIYNSDCAPEKYDYGKEVRGDITNIRKIDSLIMFPFGVIRSYSSVLFNVLPLFVLLPEYLQTSSVFIPFYKKVRISVMREFMDRNSLIYKSLNDTSLFVSRLYTFTNIDCQNVNIELVLEMKKIVWKKFGLKDSHVPKNCLIDPFIKAKLIANYKGALQTLRDEFSDQDWIEFPEKIDFSTLVNTMHDVKLFVSYSSKISKYAMFMKQDTYFVNYQKDSWNLRTASVIKACGINVVLSRYEASYTGKHDKHLIPVLQLVKLLRVLLKTIK